MTAHERGLVVFTGNVVAKRGQATHSADRMDVYLDEKGERVLRIVSSGNVRVVTSDGRSGTARRAEYDADVERLLLIGDAQVRQWASEVTGDEIELFLHEADRPGPDARCARGD